MRKRHPRIHGVPIILYISESSKDIGSRDLPLWLNLAFASHAILRKDSVVNPYRQKQIQLRYLRRLTRHLLSFRRLVRCLRPPGRGQRPPFLLPIPRGWWALEASINALGATYLRDLIQLRV